MRKPMLAVFSLALLPFLGKADDTLGRDIDRLSRRSNTILSAQDRQIFRYDTFGDIAFWGDALKLHLTLLKLNSVVGVNGFFTSGALKSMGSQRALCHLTVDDTFAPGIGQRPDGWPNRDPNVGATTGRIS
jgi:hypothetical protein